jgi:hypothetical protein
LSEQKNENSKSNPKNCIQGQLQNGKSAYQETMFKNVEVNTLFWLGRNGGFTAAQSQGTNSRSNHRCSNSQYYLAMWQSREIYCSTSSQTKQEFW